MAEPEKRIGRVTVSLPPAVGFGTSGLRGPWQGFSREVVYAHVGGFLETACVGAQRRGVAIARDLRASSPLIATLVAGSAAALGWRPINCGAIPTPALAAYAIKRGIPAIMVTGSHIPSDYNGLKFYRPDGELLKSDEDPIRVAAEGLSKTVPDYTPALPDEDQEAGAEYESRYARAFSPKALAGLNVAVFEHSAVGRDMLTRVLQALGAAVDGVGRSEDFVAVDTEALDPAAMAQIGALLETGRYHAVVSTDGDGDRPLVVDGTGTQINGDILGALTARFVGAKTIVTPLTSTSALEESGWFDFVSRTKIGSPYVVAEMARLDDHGIVGFEANGGFLLQSDFRLGGGTLDRLPTRDAIFPILAVLAAAAARGNSVQDLVEDLPARAMKADRLKNVQPEAALQLVEELARSADLRARFDESLATPKVIDTTDGTRLTTEAGDIIHFRRSGNAPELRCYVETASAEKTSATLSVMMRALENQLTARKSR